MSWTSGGNIVEVSEIEDLVVTGEAEDSQVEAARSAAKVLCAALGSPEAYIVNMSGQESPDIPSQPHSPQAAISVHVAATIPLS